MRRASALVALAAATPLSVVITPITLTGQATLTTEIDTTLITVGDRLTLEVTVEHPTDAAVAWPDSVRVDPFEVVDAAVAPTRTGDGTAVSSATFSLTAFELGELELPSLHVTVLHADGREETLETDRYGIEVVSVGVDDSGDIREIRGPLAIPLGTLRLLAWALLLMLAGAASYALYRRFRSTDDGLELPSGPPPRPPHEVALEALESLEASGLLLEGRVKEYHIRVSEILRRYVEGRFRVSALEMTTWEVLGGLQAAGVDDELRRDLRRFLDQCDRVKFAKASPGREASEAVLRLGREIVRRTTVQREQGEAKESARADREVSPAAPTGAAS